MFKTKDAHFADSYLFKGKDIASTAQVSDPFFLGETLGGVRVHGWLDDTVTCASNDTITVTLQGADSADASSWTTIGTNVVTADSTSLSGDIYNFIPDGVAKFIKVSVQGSTGMAGKFSVATELVPH